MNEELEELRRLGDSFAATIREQGRQLESGLRSISAGLDQAANRLAAALPGGGAVTLPATPPPAAVAGGGIVTVRVVNENDSPVPVTIVGAREEPADGGLFGTIAGGVGGFLGNLVGGVAGGFASPFLAFANLLTLVAGVPPILDRVLTILRETREFGRELVTAVRGLIVLLFDQLTAAGIFPVARLIASLLFLIDRGITLVLMHVYPIIVWLERLIETVTAWLGTLIQRLSSWLGRFINETARFLAAWAVYFIESIVRPAVDALTQDLLRALISAVTGMLLGALAALGEILISAGAYIAVQIERALIAFWNMLPGTTPRPVPAAPTLDWEGALRRGYTGGREAGREIAGLLLERTPLRPGPGPAPTFRAPGLRAPELRLPDMPAPGPRLEELLTAPPTPEPAPTRPEPVTVNGGVTVQIRSETVSMDNAEATARVIATHLVEELARLTQSDRFGRGLPTAAIT